MAKIIDGVYKSFDGSKALVVETSDSFLAAGHRFAKGNFKLVSNYFVNGYEPVAKSVKLVVPGSTNYKQWYFANYLNLFLGVQRSLNFYIQYESDYNKMYKTGSYRLLLYASPFFLYKSKEFAVRTFKFSEQSEKVIISDAKSSTAGGGYYAMFSYVDLHFNPNKNIDSFDIKQEYFLFTQSTTRTTPFFNYPLLKNGAAFPFSFGNFSVGYNRVSLYSLDGDYSSFIKSSEIPQLVNVAGYPILFYEDDDYIYAICDTVSMKQPFVVKLQKSAKRWKLVTGYSVGSSAVQQQLISVPTRPELGDDGQFHWYKFVYDAVEDEEGNVTYVPKFVYGSYDKDTDAVQYEDCSLDVLPDDLKLGDDDTIQHNIAIIDANVVENNGVKYLMVWTYNYQPLDKGTGEGLIPDEKRKCYLFRIDSNDSKVLTYIGEKQLPSKTVWVTPLLSKGLANYFLVWNIDRVTICKPTFDSNVFEEFGLLPINDVDDILAYGFDELDRIVVYARNSTTNDNYLFVYDNNLPEYIDISFEKDFYDSVPVDTYLALSVKNYLKEYIACQVKLVILSNNAVFTDTGNREIVVDLTTDNQPLNVDLRVEKQGRVIVKVDYVKVT